MPNLHALGLRGVVFARHHSVFPTVTRVNASSISTGAYPATRPDGQLGLLPGAPDIAAALKPFADDIEAVGGGAIYLRARHKRPSAAPAIVAALQRTPGVGAIFTAPAAKGDPLGVVPGTLSFDLAFWNHRRSADILFSPDWTDAANEHGYAGTTASGGVAGHGSSSPYDVHNTLVAAGPDLKEGVVVRVPSANVDFAPTFLGLLNVPVPSTMSGRVLREAWQNSPDSTGPTVGEITHRAETADRSYTATAVISTVETAGGRYQYFDYTRVTRTPSPASAGASR
jgi:hypothetical protein